MEIFISKGKCSECGAAGKITAVKTNGAELSLCKNCRSELMKFFIEIEKSENESSEPVITEPVRMIMAEASGMTEEAFISKYLSDPVDMVIFEYVRGYGRTLLDDSSVSMISIMSEAPNEKILERIKILSDKGIIYRINGNPDWYGADYPFAVNF